MENTNRVIIEDDEPTQAQLDLAFKRAKKEFADYVADYESDEFKAEFHEQLNTILMEATMDSLVEKGIMTREAMDGGETGYKLTPYGEALGEYATSV